MVSHVFQLQPFAGHARPEGLIVGGEISRSGQDLQLLFRVSGSPDALKVPLPLPRPCRRDGLWQSTCFECFFRPAGSRGYWELNISPCGCWNLYHFSGYREGMSEESAVGTVAGSAAIEDGDLVLRCSLPLEALLGDQEVLTVSLSCVLEDKAGERSYWALHHPADRPDFHHPAAFILEL